MMMLAAALVTVRLFWLHPPVSVRVNGKEYHTAAKLDGDLKLEVAGTPPLAIHGPLDIATRDGHLLLTLHMPREEYVAGVLGGESSVFKSEEALAAMAVAARTYAVKHAGRHAAEGFDFCDTTHCQDLRLAAMSERLRAAAESTDSEVLWYEGRPADTYYHRNCGGTTEAADQVWSGIHVPYLKQQIDTFCARAEWQSTVSKAELGGAFAILGHTPTGRASEVRVGARRMSAMDFLLNVGRTLGWEKIRSNMYTVVDRGNEIVFQGYGAGHGVGLCQDGAEARGEHGHTYRQILAFYYPGTSLGVGAQGFAWSRMNGERVEVFSTHAAADADVVAKADHALKLAESRAEISVTARPRLRVFPSVAAFRDSTGEPGYLAASTRGRVVRMQPAALLRGSGTLDSTLLHEMLHVAVESVAHPRTPLWFREGLVLYLAADPKQPVSEAQSRVRKMVEQYGRATVMDWLRTGTGEPEKQAPAKLPAPARMPK